MRLRHIQFSTSNHITYDKYMPMSTDGKENSSHSKKSKHFFAGIGTCISPTLNACVDTLSKFINFSDVKPGNIFSIEVGF